LWSRITRIGGSVLFGVLRDLGAKLLPDVLEGRISPGRVFDRVTSLDGVPDGYRAMDAREAIKVLIEF
jgi:threonine dehydrogenase-like Zn-dependent dehydrogenase